MTIPGHVFVVHSRMEDVQFDAAVVPTGKSFHVRSYWGPVLGVEKLLDPTHVDVDHLKPTRWPRRGFGRARASGTAGPETPTWFLNVAVGRFDALMHNLTGVLDDIAKSADVTPGEGRPLRLVALNTIGVGGGGFDSRRGEVIDRMLATCEEAAVRHELDIVITCASASDYAAFQHLRRRRADSFRLLRDEQKAHGSRLARLAVQGELALFLGAGVSIPAGLPSWWDLLNTLGERCGVTQEQLRGLESPLDQAQLIRHRLGGDLKPAVRDLLHGVQVPSLGHVQLAALGCREVVTTNYDSLYERAANAFAEPPDRIKVLPFEQKKPFERWILKMHGDLRHDGELILSRSDFVGYSATFGPVGSIVQSLMLTKHLLVVGTSLTDDNFLRLAYEVTNYLNAAPAGLSQPQEPFGTVLSLRAEATKRELWEGTFHVVGASSEPDPALEGLSPELAGQARKSAQDRRARDLSIMLDYIAMEASPDNYLLDPRYVTLLTPDQQKAAEAARTLAAHTSDLANSQHGESGWDRLNELLHTLGADGSTDA